MKKERFYKNYLKGFSVFGVFLIIGISVLFALKIFSPKEVRAEVTPDPIREFVDQPSWCPKLKGDDSPYNFSEEMAESLTVICGTIFDSNAERSLSGVRVALYELNDTLPVGMWEGRPDGLFSSTATDSHGRFHLLARKIGPGNKKLVAALSCNNTPIGSMMVSSLFDMYSLDAIPYVPEYENCSWTVPPVEAEIADRKDPPLALDTGPEGFQGDLPAGSSMDQDITFNNSSGEPIFDIRHARYFMGVDTTLPFEIYGVNVSPLLSALFPDNAIGLQSTGGMYEKDCVTRYEAQDDLNGVDANYYCNVDGAMDEQDYLTRGAFRFIPKSCSDVAELRFEMRSNLVRLNRDTMAVGQTVGTLFNTFNTVDNLAFRVRGGEDPSDSFRIDCDCLLAANSVEPDPALAAKCPDVNNLLTAGPVSRMSGPYDFAPMEGEELEVLRDLSDIVCQRSGCLVTVGDLFNCASDPTNCVCGIKEENARGYFRSETSPRLVVGHSYEGIRSYAAKDSYEGSLNRPDRFNIANSAQNLPEGAGTGIEMPTGWKNCFTSGCNSTNFMLALASNEITVPDPRYPTRTFADGFTGPFNTIEDYYTWRSREVRILSIQTPTAHIAPGSNDPDKFITPESEPLLEPHNDFESYADWNIRGGKGHSQNLSTHTAIYLSEEGIKRDEYLSGDIGQLGEGREAYSNQLSLLGSSAYGSSVFRNLLDTIWVTISGNGYGAGGMQPSMPFDWNPSTGLSFAEQIQSFLALGIGSYNQLNDGTGDNKSFGHRRDAGTITKRDELMAVKYDFCEGTYLSSFKMPEPPYLIDSWGSHQCYPWHNVEVCDPPNRNTGSTDYGSVTDPPTQNCLCNTFPGPGNGLSRSCRVEGCRVKTFTVECECQSDGSYTDCQEYEEERECNDADVAIREECAINQRSCYDEETKEVSDETWECAAREKDIDDIWDDLYDRINCGPNKCREEPEGSGIIVCNDDRESTYLAACALGVVDYNVCPGSLDMPELDDRIKQENPLAPGAHQFDTDPIVDHLTIFNMSLMGPLDQKTTNMHASLSDQERTNERNTDSRFLSYGAELIETVGGETSVAQYKARVRSPILAWASGGAAYSPSVNLIEEPVYYHVNPGAEFIGGLRPGIDEMFPLQMAPSRQAMLQADGTTAPWNTTVMIAPEDPADSPITNTIFGDYHWAADDELLKENSEGKAYAQVGVSDPEFIAPPLNNFGECDVHYCDNKSVPWLSNTALNVINSAANTFDVPAAMILAYMATEGEAFSPPLYDRADRVNYYADDAVVDYWSKEYYGRIETDTEFQLCNELKFTEQGPGSWIKNWWEKMLDPELVPNIEGNPNPCQALNAISDRRCESASRCNFLDVMYVLAYALSQANYPTCGSWNSAAVRDAADAISGGAYDTGQVGNVLNVYSSCDTGNRPLLPEFPEP